MKKFQFAMLTKTLFPSFSQFMIALQGYEQSLTAQKGEEKTIIEHVQVFIWTRQSWSKWLRRQEFQFEGKEASPYMVLLSCASLLILAPV